MESNTLRWDEIVDAHSPQVYRLAYRLTGNRQDAEDLMQDVFVRVFNSLESYEPGNFAGWIHRITTNLFLDKARKAQRQKTLALFDDAEERMPSADVLPEYVVHDAGFDPDVETALGSLPREFRVAVVLCDVEGLSYEEISDVLGVKLGTVRSRIHRGRAQLRAALSHREPSRGRTRFLGPVGV
ncbi:RNA polymerase sigma factor SigE [Aeromicrobium phragmitis]|uniref:RNA polymerase sigma factor SigE n=1 Tax=Aeromicrobium phragmitis TaxID=2478914 RepID=A0A3L8PHK2_9ACTN|nr:RNA polymerase sigma factor SigE [Aeromicrobium phragmitis]RLV54651.1 RNA polymerase sigma factor SigE [Aeromicrobium phragmitis]